MKTARMLLIATITALAACSHSEPPPPPAAAAQPAPLSNSNVFATDVRALQKAKDVQKTVDQQKQASDKQLDEAEGGGH
jgi:hypothetical protein